MNEIGDVRGHRWIARRISAGPPDLRRRTSRFKIPRPHGRGYFLPALRASSPSSSLGSIFPRRHPSLHPHRQSLNSQKAFGVGLVVGAAAFHGGDAFVVEIVRTATAGDLDVAFVKIEFHFAGDRLLGLADEG